MIDLTYHCGGCDAVAKGTKPLTRTFHRMIPTGGLGVWRWNNPEECTPAGWMASDPYTACCYCPKCWAGIENVAPADHSYSAA